MRRSQIIKELGQIMVERNRVNLQARKCRRVLRREHEPHYMGLGARARIPRVHRGATTLTATRKGTRQHAIMPKGDVTARRARMPSILY